MNTLSNIKALILDMDGVLWQSNEPIGNLPAIFENITERGLKVTLATNNSTRTAEQHLEKVNSFGVDLSVDQVLSSSMATAALMKENFPNGGDLYVVGHEGLTEALKAKGFDIFQEAEVPEKPLAVVAGIDWEITYEKIANATLLIRKGAPFYGTNPDITYPTPRGLMPGAGTILAAIQTSSGVEPTVAGKPKPYLLQLAMRRMGASPEETLMVGDRLTTDILGGHNAGCNTALVLSGVTKSEEIATCKVQPDLIAANLAEVLEKLD